MKVSHVVISGEEGSKLYPDQRIRIRVIFTVEVNATFERRSLRSSRLLLHTMAVVAFSL